MFLHPIFARAKSGLIALTWRMNETIAINAPISKNNAENGAEYDNNVPIPNIERIVGNWITNQRTTKYGANFTTTSLIWSGNVYGAFSTKYSSPSFSISWTNSQNFALAFSLSKGVFFCACWCWSWWWFSEKCGWFSPTCWFPSMPIRIQYKTNTYYVCFAKKQENTKRTFTLP